MKPVDFYRNGPLIAMLGNPNAGKTSLFNILTGSKQKVANYAGVTVERVEGRLIGHADIRVLDLPGTYSMHPRSPDEKVTVDVLKGVARGERRPDLVICVLDATNLRRGLRLLLAAQRLGLPAVAAVNMIDLAKKRGVAFDAGELSRRLGIPVVETSALHHEGIEALVALVNDPAKWPGFQADLSAVSVDDNARLKEILTALNLNHVYPDQFTDRLDRILLNPWLGTLILMAVIFFVFQAVFAWSRLPMEWIEAAFGALGDFVSATLPDGLLKDLILEAVVGGVGGVAAFLPQIIVLFFFILLMEESGYLPRAAFLLDRTMGSVGLSGRSFLPLLSGYACAVPAILASRIVGNRRDRWATIAIAPLLTCSARLPVYAVMVGAFVPDQSVYGFGLQGLVLFALYLMGMAGALLVAWILKHTAGRGEYRTLMLELPSYHLPQVRSILSGLWQRARVYLEKVGTVILAMTMLLWVLVSFPGAPAGATDPAINYSFAGMLGRAIEPVFAPLGFNWQMCISLIPAMGAREVAVAVLGTLYATGDEGLTLSAALHDAWTVPMGLSFLAFFVFSPSCFATLAAIRREMGTWKAPAVLFVAYSLLAYVFAFGVYRAALWVCG